MVGDIISMTVRYMHFLQRSASRKHPAATSSSDKIAVPMDGGVAPSSYSVIDQADVRPLINHTAESISTKYDSSMASNSLESNRMLHRPHTSVTRTDVQNQLKVIGEDERRRLREEGRKALEEARKSKGRILSLTTSQISTDQTAIAPAVLLFTGALKNSTTCPPGKLLRSGKVVHERVATRGVDKSTFSPSSGIAEVRVDGKRDSIEIISNKPDDDEWDFDL